MALTAWSVSQAALASTRTFPCGPSALATAATRSQSPRRLEPGSATFTFAVVHPPDSFTSCAATSGAVTGIVTFTGTCSRLAAGNAVVAAASPARNHREDSWAS